MEKVVESQHYAEQGGRARGPLAAFIKYHSPTKLRTILRPFQHKSKDKAVTVIPRC